jgi:hypothetical protein
MEVKIGQRWRYIDSKYNFVIEIVDEDGGGRVVDSITAISKKKYPIGERYYMIIKYLVTSDGIEWPSSIGNSWKYIYLVGQDKSI